MSTYSDVVLLKVVVAKINIMRTIRCFIAVWNRAWDQGWLGFQKSASLCVPFDRYVDLAGAVSYIKISQD